LTNPDATFELDPTMALKSSKLQQAYQYWNSIRGDRFAPSRSDIDPRTAKALLAHLQIFDVLDGGRAYRPRLVGTLVARTIKEDATGQTFDDSSPRPVVHRTLRAMRWVVEHRKPLRTLAARTALEGHDFLAHETLFLPLSSDGIGVDMMAVVGEFSPAVT
jgi:hypothetical protein